VRYIHVQNQTNYQPSTFKLFVSLLTTAVSYPFSLYFQLCAVTVSVAYELVMVAYVYRRFPILAVGEGEKRTVQPAGSTRASTQRPINTLVHKLRIEIVQMCKDIIEFSRLPIFLSAYLPVIFLGWSAYVERTGSISISLVYLTTLSFDGIMLSYLKSQRGLSDSFIAGMRGIAVVMGLVGTLLMPWLERRVGLVRGGAWSLWSVVSRSPRCL
jgi:solute carrier family 40 (iron-regulated transporter), member 1